MYSLQLNDNWDLCIDNSGDIALCTAPYSKAQEVANAVRTFLGECYYNTNLGVPYFETVFKTGISMSEISHHIKKAAETVEDVYNVITALEYDIVERKLKGQIRFNYGNEQLGVITL